MDKAGAPSRGDHGGVLVAAVVAVVALLAVLMAEVIYLLVLHEEPGYPTVAQAPAAAAETTEGSPDPESPPDDETPTPSEVGETRFADNADTTLLQIRHIRPPSAYAPPGGAEWYGVRARTCLHADARPSGGLPWSSWAVADRDGTRYLGSEPPWDDYPAQQLPTTGLQPGRCNLGWVLIALPEGTSRRISAVLFRPRSATPAEWAV